MLRDSSTRGLQATIGDQFTFRVEKQPKGPVPDGKIGMSNTYDFMGLNAKTKSPPLLPPLAQLMPEHSPSPPLPVLVWLSKPRRWALP